MGQLNVAVVSAERALWRGIAKSVVAKTPEGEIGILPGHEPMLALLVESPLRIEVEDGSTLFVAVHGGFLSIDSDNVNVIAGTAELASSISIERAKAALDRIKASSEDDEVIAAARRRAETRITVASVAAGVSGH